MKYFYLILSILIFTSCNQLSKRHLAINGVLDLRQISLKNAIKLDGKWNFYWHKLYPNQKIEEKGQSIEVPGIWNKVKSQNIEIGSLGFATYQLFVILPKVHNEELTLKVNSFATASSVYINGYRVSENGQVSEKKENSKPKYNPHSVRINVYKIDTLEIRVLISNFHHKKGGFWDSIELAENETIESNEINNYILKAFLLGCIFIMSLYHLGLFTIRGTDKSPLYFSLFYFMLFVRIGVTENMILAKMLHLSWIVTIRLEYISFYLAVPFFFIFLHSLFHRFFSKLIVIISFVIAISISLITLFTDSIFFSKLMNFYEIITLFLGVYSIVALFYAKKKHLTGAGIMIYGFTIFFICFINDLLIEENIINTVRFLQIGIVMFIFFQAFLLSKRFSKAYNEAEQYSTRLNFHNRNLERIVKERTAEIENQKTELVIQSSLIQEAYDDIINKNQEIIAQRDDLKMKSGDITSSLVYAKRIQTAVLPNLNDIKLLLSEYFILYKPKDIVSGDFYWMAEKNNKVYIVVADSTGHGVPGAFMSMLGIAFLNEIINKKNISTSADILEELRVQIKKVLGQTGMSEEQKDGMDIGISIIDKSNNILQFSGAYHSLYLYRKHNENENEENDLILLKGNRQPVGVFPKEIPFTLLEIQLYEDDVFYMFTDGYESQFGGERGEIFKIRRLKELLKNINKLPMEEQQFELESVYDGWRNTNEQVDDILILGVRVSAKIVEIESFI